MNHRTLLRGFLFALILASAGMLIAGWQTSPSDAVATAEAQIDRPVEERDRVVPGRDGATVITTDPPGSNVGTSAIIAFTADGRPLYYNDTYGNYFDVDPDSPGSRTVLYVAGSRYDPCPPSLVSRANETYDSCAEISVERVNLSTGDTERVHTAVTPNDIWHDVDRIDDHRLLVADIHQDRTFILNTTTDEIEWEWQASSDLRPDSGGQPADWTHINDVELLHDGRIMVSLRNQDRVAFIEPEDGLDRNWTLGAEDAYGVLYEQHNPDYIPESRGGPAVVVADSENNRVAEYQRVDSRWRRVWTWQDSRLRWPRDADRLPGGHTLVTDSQGNRIIELDEDDEIVWSIAVSTPYEAERLGTGDESSNGQSKAELQDTDRLSSADDITDEQARSHTGLDWLVAFVRGPVVNGLLYIAPSWVTVHDLTTATVFTCTGLCWVLLELHWSRFGIESLRRWL